MPLKDPEKRKEYNRRWREKNMTKERRKEYEKVRSNMGDKKIYEKRMESLRKRWAMNPNINRKQLLRRRYGMTIPEYENKLKDQNGVCAICKNPETQKRKGKIQSLAVDHNHKTGEIRGLLCSHCNNMIGRASDNIDTLKNAIIYLTKYDRSNNEEE